MALAAARYHGLADALFLHPARLRALHVTLNVCGWLGVVGVALILLAHVTQLTPAVLASAPVLLASSDQNGGGAMNSDFWMKAVGGLLCAIAGGKATLWVKQAGDGWLELYKKKSDIDDASEHGQLIRLKAEADALQKDITRLVASHASAVAQQEKSTAATLAATAQQAAVKDEIIADLRDRLAEMKAELSREREEFARERLAFGAQQAQVIERQAHTAERAAETLKASVQNAGKLADKVAPALPGADTPALRVDAHADFTGAGAGDKDDDGGGAT